MVRPSRRINIIPNQFPPQFLYNGQLPPRTTIKLIDVLANDIIHTSEKFAHSTTITASGNSGVTFPVINGLPGDLLYWFQSLNGTSTFTTREDGATSSVVLSGFEFSQDVGIKCDVKRYASWGGGQIDITSAWGVSHVIDVTFSGWINVDKSSAEFGRASGIFVGPLGVIEVALPTFNGTAATQTVLGDGVYRFGYAPKLSIEAAPQHGTVAVQNGKVRYSPDGNSDGVDSFKYKVMTPLGDKDIADVKIGTIDLDIEDFDGSVLNEIEEDVPGAAVRLNNDDDNKNDVVDLADAGRDDKEDDLVKLSIIPKIPNGSDAEGYVYLLYGWGDSNIWGADSAIKIWHEKDKSQPSEFAKPYVDSSTRFDIHGSASQFELWVEGIKPRSTDIVMVFKDTRSGISLEFDDVIVNVVTIDLDIDSDNDNGFALPARTKWEEFLEDNKYGLGKLVMQNFAAPDAANNFTPVVLETTRELKTGSGDDWNVRINYKQFSAAGTILLWTRNKNDPLRNGDDVANGGSRISEGGVYTLAQLGYSPLTGLFAPIYVAGNLENLLIKQLKGVEDNGKPQEYIKATLLKKNAPVVSDQAKYLVTQPNSFFFRFQNDESVRNAIASSRVYGNVSDQSPHSYDPPVDSPDYCQELLDADQLRLLGITEADVITDLTTVNLASGFKAALYRDYVSNKYIIAFAGTEMDVIADIYTDLVTGSTGFVTPQFISAIKIGNHLSSVTNLRNGNLIATGHSLGGGLASAAIVTGESKIYGHTFNAMGLPELTKLYIAANYWTKFSPYASLVDAYYVDYDILSYLQDNIRLNLGLLSFDPMAEAIGM